MTNLFSQVKWWVDTFVMFVIVVASLLALLGLSCLTASLAVIGTGLKGVAKRLNGFGDWLVYKSVTGLNDF